MKSVAAAALVVLLCGSASANRSAIVRASVDKQGNLTLRGQGWHRCGVVRVSLPSPWGDATALVNAGTFVLEYPKPCGLPEAAAFGIYRGRVEATQKPCGGKPALRAEADIPKVRG